MISTKSTNIIHIIRQHYGESILSEARHLERTRIKYAKYTNHLRFSLRCHHNNLIPKDLRLKSRIKTSRSKQAVFPRRSNISAYNLLTNHHSLPDDGRSISRNVANINIRFKTRQNCSFRTFYNMISTESTSIIHIIRQQYGESILSEARHLERTRIKYAKYTNHLRFSLRCHHNNLIPKDLRLKSRIKTSRSKQAVFPRRSDISAYNLLTNHHSLPDDGRSIKHELQRNKHELQKIIIKLAL